MRYLKTYENFNQNFKIDDIVVCKEQIPIGFGEYMKIGQKFIVIDTFGHGMKLKKFDGEQVRTGSTSYWDMSNFIALKDWELYNNTNKYNL